MKTTKETKEKQQAKIGNLLLKGKTIEETAGALKISKMTVYSSIRQDMNIKAASLIGELKRMGPNYLHHYVDLLSTMVAIKL